MEKLRKIVEDAQLELNRRVKKLLEVQGCFQVEQYARFLTMQSFLTKDVQQEFYNMAGNHSLQKRKSLRKFLVKFAEEEEPHYAIAEKDLNALGLKPGEKPIDVALWKVYFEKQVLERPFIRIGATCILENIAETSTKEILELLSNTPELNSASTRFIRIHMHGPDLPHGDQVFEAIECIELSQQEIDDLEFGARIGRKIYLQLIDWVITGQELNSLLIDNG